MTPQERNTIVNRMSSFHLDQLAELDGEEADLYITSYARRQAGEETTPSTAPLSTPTPTDEIARQRDFIQRFNSGRDAYGMRTNVTAAEVDRYVFERGREHLLAGLRKVSPWRQQ